MNRVVHFEIQAENLERAMKFYKDVFGWEYVKWLDNPPYWGIMTGSTPSKNSGQASSPQAGAKKKEEPGINGGFLTRPNKTPPPEYGTNAFVCTIQVEDYDAAAKKIAKAGGKVALPKFAIAGMAWQGYYIDTEGNTFGIHQPDEMAK